MHLTLQSQLTGDVVVIRCQGRIVAGEEVEALQEEFDEQTKISGTNVLLVKKVVLHLAETSFIDSSGLGTLLRMSGVLKAADGDLKLCNLSPFVLRVLQVTNLLNVIHTYPSEKEAMAAFSGGRREHPAGGKSQTAILCVDPSSDLLAYISTLLKRSGYTVYATRNPGEVMTLVTASKPRIVICGPGVPAMPMAAAVLDRLRKNEPGISLLQLPADFSTAEAGQAGVDLLNSVKALVVT